MIGTVEFVKKARKKRKQQMRLKRGGEKILVEILESSKIRDGCISFCGNVGCFCLLVIAYNVAVHVGTRILFEILQSGLLGIHPEEEF